MQFSAGILIGFLLLTSSINISIGDDESESESCSPTNTTYSLCIVSEGNITVVSKEFSGEELLDQCAETFLDEHLTTHVCHDHNEEETEDRHPTSAQKYGYGFLAVFIISVLSLGGLLAFPCIYRISFQYVLVTFTALAVGTLFGDALLHLIPFALGLHSHESEESGHSHGTEDEEHDHSKIRVQAYQWKLFTAVMVLYGFYLLEVLLHWIAHIRDKDNSGGSHGHSHGVSISDHTSAVRLEDGVSHGHSHQHNYNELDPTLVCVGKSCSHHTNSFSTKKETREIVRDVPPKGKKATGWMIILGDGIHNFADGLAIGAAFSEDLMLGLTTTIAVGCHELPHEFGDYAILINSGFSHCSALFWNFISATTAFIGFFVGAAVSTNETTRQWIFAVTIGMFLYIALVDLLPTLLPEGRIQIKRFICVNIGFLAGIAIMFILAIFEDRLMDVGQ